MPSTQQHPGRPRRSSERGSALIIALLIIIALTGLGVVGLAHTTQELRPSGTTRYNKQAYYTSEAGMMAAMQRVGSNGEAYWRYMKKVARAERERAGNAGAVPTYQFSSGEFAGAGSLFGTSNQGFEGQQGTNASFTVRFGDPKDGPRPAGFSQEFCFKRFTFRSTGMVGTAIPAAELDVNEAVQTGTARHVGSALVGPMLCDEGYAR